MIEEWKNRYQNSGIDPIVAIKGGDVKSDGAIQQGTWAHRLIAIQFAQWCSPKFALWVSEKIDNLIRQRYNGDIPAFRQDILDICFLTSES